MTQFNTSYTQVIGFGNYGVYCEMHVKIYSSDTPMAIAEKIWEFDVLASCTIYGFAVLEEKQKVVPKGELVLLELRKLYERECMAGGKRKHVFRPESIGGPLAHKIFTWEKRVVDSEVRFTIWRYQ